MTSPDPSDGGRQSILSSSLTALGRLRTANAFDRNNIISVFLMGALPPIAGSSVSFMLAAFFIWGLVSLALRRFEPRLTRSDQVMAGTFTLFAALIFATGLLAGDPLRLLGSTIWLLPFLSLWVIIPRLRASPRLDYVSLYVSGAVAGCLGALLLILLKIGLWGHYRPEGGAGNAAVFATMCLCLSGIAGLAMIERSRRRRILALAAFFAGALAMALSLTRGVMLAFLPILVVLTVYMRRQWRLLPARGGMLVLVAVSAVALYAAWDLLASRVAFTIDEFELIMEGEHSRSIGERLRLWSAAWQAFLDSPLWGHGIQNRMDALTPYLMQDDLPLREFSHPHNGYLSFAVDGGLVALTALLALLAVPVFTAWHAPRDETYRKRLFLAVMLTTAYAAVGLTQIMFKHDIIDSFYIFTAVVLAASIPDGEGRPRPVADRPPSGASLASRTAEGLSNLVETYLFPIFAALVVAGGVVQSFLSAEARDAIKALLGL